MIGESLMKNTLRLMTIFMGIIGGCAAILVVFILAVYPNLNHNTLIKNNETPSEQIILQLIINKMKIHLRPSTQILQIYHQKRSLTLNLSNQVHIILMT